MHGYSGCYQQFFCWPLHLALDVEYTKPKHSAWLPELLQELLLLAISCGS